jgi:hypothetical protein
MKNGTSDFEKARRAARFFDRIHRLKHNGRDYLAFPSVARRPRENFLDYVLRVYDAFPEKHPFKPSRRKRAKR